MSNELSCVLNYLMGGSGVEAVEVHQMFLSFENRLNSVGKCLSGAMKA